MTDVNKILSERGGTHGDFSDNARITQSLKNLSRCQPGFDCLNDVQREALDVIYLKIGRILSNQPDFKDHWDDIAGYATLVANRCSQAPATQSPAEKMLERMDAIRKSTTQPAIPLDKPKVGKERQCSDGSREMWTGKHWVKVSAAPPQPRDNLKAGDKLHCAQCDNCMRINAAGYCLCEVPGCPNVGKKVM